MIIKLQYFPLAEDDMDAEASEAKYQAWANSIDDAEAWLGMVERHNEVNEPEEELELDFFSDV